MTIFSSYVKLPEGSFLAITQPDMASAAVSAHFLSVSYCHGHCHAHGAALAVASVDGGHTRCHSGRPHCDLTGDHG